MKIGILRAVRNIEWTENFKIAHFRSQILVCQSEKSCESGFSYCFLTDFTKFFLLGSTLLDFGFLTEEVSWTHRIFKIWYHDKKNKKIQIRQKFKGLDWFSQNLVSNIT